MLESALNNGTPASTESVVRQRARVLKKRVESGKSYRVAHFVYSVTCQSVEYVQRMVRVESQHVNLSWHICECLIPFCHFLLECSFAGKTDHAIEKEEHAISLTDIYCIMGTCQPRRRLLLLFISFIFFRSSFFDVDCRRRFDKSRKFANRHHPKDRHRWILNCFTSELTSSTF